MKKRIISLIALVLLTAALFSGCGKKVECDLCGDVKTCKTADLYGQDINICKDCEKGLEELADLFG